MGEHGGKISYPFCNCLRVISIPMDDGFVLNRPLNSFRTQQKRQSEQIFVNSKDIMHTGHSFECIY